MSTYKMEKLQLYIYHKIQILMVVKTFCRGLMGFPKFINQAIRLG